jgi:hypothetical protein
MSLEVSPAGRNPMPPAISPPSGPYRPMTIGDWVVTKLVLMIPLVGFVMLFVWAFTDDVHPSRKTFCQSALIFLAIGIGLGILVWVTVLIFVGLAASAAHNS